MSSSLQKKQMSPVSTAVFLSRLREGVKVVFDAGRECGAPSSFTLPLADAMSSLDSAISICRLHIAE